MTSYKLVQQFHYIKKNILLKNFTRKQISKFEQLTLCICKNHLNLIINILA